MVNVTDCKLGLRCLREIRSTHQSYGAIQSRTADAERFICASRVPQNIIAHFVAFSLDLSGSLMACN